MLSPRKNPCASCPYRKDVPSGIWAESEYDKLPKYDGDIPEQAMNAPESVKLFSCHQTDGHLCSGWVANTGDPADKLAIRLGLSSGLLDPSIIDYTTDTALFATGAEAAEHGKRDIENPNITQHKAVQKIKRVRALRGNPIQE